MLPNSNGLRYLVRQPTGAANAPATPAHTIVLLHGFGADAADLFSLSAYLPDNQLVIAIQAPIALGFGGYAWYQLTPAPVGFQENTEDRNTSAKLLRQSLPEIIAKEGGSLEHVTILGFSQGAAMAYDLMFGANRTTLNVNRVIALSGFLPGDVMPVKGENTARYFIGHGNFDGLVPIAKAHAANNALIDAGHDVTFSTYDIEHGISEEELGDIVRWLSS